MSEKVTKDRKHVEASRKGREKYMNKLKESLLNDIKKVRGDTTNGSNETTSATNNSSIETTSVTNTATTRPNDTYVYGVGILAVLAISVYVFFTYSTFTNNKKLINEKKRLATKTTSYAFRKYRINE